MLRNTTAAIQILNNNLVSANGAAVTAVPDPFENKGKTRWLNAYPLKAAYYPHYIDNGYACRPFLHHISANCSPGFLAIYPNVMMLLQLAPDL